MLPGVQGLHGLEGLNSIPGDDEGGRVGHPSQEVCYGGVGWVQELGLETRGRGRGGGAQDLGDGELGHGGVPGGGVEAVHLPALLFLCYRLEEVAMQAGKI